MKKYIVILLSALFILSCAKNGEDGQTPFIGENGNWWIGNTDTGVPASGNDGTTPTIVIGNNGNWWINGVDTGVSAKGKDGDTPVIGENGNWWINGVDTGVPATGSDGSTPSIGANGNWWINGMDTGIKATGTEGGEPIVVTPPTKPVVDEPIWTLDENVSTMQYDMTFVLLPSYYGHEIQVSAQDKMAAFIGDRCLGLASVVPVTYEDGTIKNIFFLMVKGASEENGKEIVLRYYQKSTSALYENSIPFYFVANVSYGSGGIPYNLQLK